MKNLKHLFLALLIASGVGVSVNTVFSATRSSDLYSQKALNQGVPNGAAARLGDKVVFKTTHTFRAYWDFAVHGGATTATFTLKDAISGDSAVLPKGAIVRDCLLDVVTQPSPTAGASWAISTGQSAGDLKAATASSALTGLVACVPVGSAATAIKLTADRTMTAILTGNPVTSGKFYVLVTYELSDTL